MACGPTTGSAANATEPAFDVLSDDNLLGESNGLETHVWLFLVTTHVAKFFRSPTAMVKGPLSPIESFTNYEKGA